MLKVHDATAVTDAALALQVALLKTLVTKGLLTNSDVTDIFNSAIAGANAPAKATLMALVRSGKR